MASTMTDRQRASIEERQALLTKRSTLRLDTAARENRDLTDAEQQQHTQDLGAIASFQAQLDRLDGDDDMRDQIDQLASGGNSAIVRPTVARRSSVRLASLGEQFLASDTFNWLKSTHNKRSGAWTSTASELQFQATTLTEGAGSGGALLVPDYQPGIVPSPTAPVVMAQLFQPGQATSNSITFMRETLFTNAAAPVAEVGLKPESTLTFTAQNEPLRKIAHHLPVSEEMLEDVPAIRSYIDARLRLGVLLELDDQLLHGSGVAPEMTGLLIRSDLAAPVVATAGSELDAIAGQISAIESTQGLRVSGIVVNPSTWLSLSLSKNLQGEYLGSSPFETPQTATLFGVPIARTPMMPVGQALVGAYNTGGAQLFIRNGIQVAATNSHADDFIHNLIRIRAEIRAALAVYRSAAFGLVTGLGATTAQGLTTPPVGRDRAEPEKTKRDR
jgi:HK97 family phage major capsid protein